MKVLIIEVCRSPETIKITAPMMLMHFFIERGVDHELISNDGIWSERTVLNKELFKKLLIETECEIIHLAMHGDANGLVLKWSEDVFIENRVADDLLLAPEIEKMNGLKGKLIVSVACATARLAPAFLKAGSRGVIAPENVIIWTNLGLFFRYFYGNLLSGQDIEIALSSAKLEFPELESYRFFNEL